MFKKSLTVILFAIMALTLVACGSKKAVTKTQPPKAKKASAKDVKPAVLRDARTDMLEIEKVTNDPAGFNSAMANKALEAFTKALTDDMAAGKVKIRKYQNLKLRFVDFNQGLARVSVTFSDSSHYASKDDMGAAMTFPKTEEKSMMLHLINDGKRWKIVAVAPGQ